jgi:predicted nucleic acid-binding protein
MKDRIFIDTNIFVYSAVADSHHANRRQKAIELIQSEDHEIVISTQVLNEFSVILIKNGIGDMQFRNGLPRSLKIPQLIQ